MKPHRRKRPNRAGYALVLFVIMSFGLLGLAALVIDMGFSRLAQRQMQTAVDSAALEGLRWRDVLSDPARRTQASSIVASLFTDYVDPNTGETVHYGAGPVVTFSGGIGPTELAASQLMQPGTPPVYQPTGGLELNTNNDQEGDMVAGTYNPGQPSAEGDDYTRADFTPARSGSSTAGAFLVRLRRTGSTSNTSALDQVSGVSSSGPTLPILFGRGSMMARSGSSGQLSVLSGITVRATAIAAAEIVSSGTLTYSAGLAKTVGAVDPAGTYPGHVPFAVNSDIWAQLATSGGTLTASGGILTMAVTPGKVPDGLVLATTANGTSLWAAGVSCIGQAIAVATDSGALGAYPTAFPAYVPIYTTTPLGGQAYTVIGFGYLAPGRVQPPGTSAIVISPPNGLAPTYPVAAQNASAAIALATLAGLSPQDVNTLFNLPAVPSLAPYMIYAPVLVNHYIGPTAATPTP